MRVIVLVLLVMVLVRVSGVVAAEWVALGNAGSGDDYYDIYVNPGTIRKSGNMVKIWSMLDFKTTRVVPGRPSLSVKLQTESDCTNARLRFLYHTRHSGNMGKGNVVSNDDGVPGNWSSVPPASINESLWKYACGKR